MNIRLQGRGILGDVLVRETRPAAYMEERDAAGNVVKVEQTLPAEFTVVNATPVRSGLPIMPIAAAVAAFLLLK